MSYPVRMFAAFLFCVTMLPAALSAEDAPAEADIAGVQAVISAQMEAFKHDDGEAAFAFAAPGIRKMFATPEIFMAMVRQQYAPVYRPRYVEYLEPAGAGDHFLQPLILTGENGVTVVARYVLRRQAGGDWRIMGVTLSPASDQAPH
jgi:hypothetical protein